MNGKGSTRRPGRIPDDCPIYAGKKPAYQKIAEELEANTGRFRLKDGKLIKNVQTPNQA